MFCVFKFVFFFTISHLVLFFFVELFNILEPFLLYYILNLSFATQTPANCQHLDNCWQRPANRALRTWTLTRRHLCCPWKSDAVVRATVVGSCIRYQEGLGLIGRNLLQGCFGLMLEIRFFNCHLQEAVHVCQRRLTRRLDSRSTVVEAAVRSDGQNMSDLVCSQLITLQPAVHQR